MTRTYPLSLSLSLALLPSLSSPVLSFLSLLSLSLSLSSVCCLSYLSPLIPDLFLLSSSPFLSVPRFPSTVLAVFILSLSNVFCHSIFQSFSFHFTLLSFHSFPFSLSCSPFQQFFFCLSVSKLYDHSILQSPLLPFLPFLSLPHLCS